ncbi:MAG: hypothetical protein ABI867_26340 [Kofleriaceae bacterium]
MDNHQHALAFALARERAEEAVDPQLDIRPVLAADRPEVVVALLALARLLVRIARVELGERELREDAATALGEPRVLVDPRLGKQDPHGFLHAVIVGAVLRVEATGMTLVQICRGDLRLCSPALGQLKLMIRHSEAATVLGSQRIALGLRMSNEHELRWPSHA